MTHTFDPFDPEAWPDAPGCDAFEQALMLRSQAALAPSAVPVLDTHLTACESCRAYAARMADVDAALVAFRGDDVALPSWQRARDRLHDEVRRYQRRTPWIMTLSLVIALGGSIAIHAVFDPAHTSVRNAISSMLVASLLLGGIMASVYGAGRRRMERLLESHDVVATYRGELERKLRRARSGLWFWPAAFLLRLPATIDGLTHTLDDHARAHLVTSVVLIVLEVLAFTRCVVRTRRLSRELAGLK